MPDQDIRFTHRHMPHWHAQGATYFVTFRVKRVALSPDERLLVLSHLRSGDLRYYTLIAVTVMPTHVHTILTADRGFDISRILKGMKGVSARLINMRRHSRGTVWLNESFDRILGSQGEIIGTLKYMLHNSVEAFLATDPWHYQGWFCCSEYAQSLEAELAR
jgi:putative transposase